MKLGQLTEAGLEVFADYLVRARLGEAVTVPTHLLSDPDCSAVLSEDIVVDAGRSFTNRFECSGYLHGVLAGAPLGTDRNVGLWAWLSLLYFDQVCPIGKDGRRRVGEHARYIPEPNAFQRFYRHLLLGPYLVYRAHKDHPAAAGAVLASPVAAPGDMVEQLASRQELVSNVAAMSVATKLYVDDKGNLKRGAGGKGAGSVRRLVDILNQFDLTYDLYAMPSDELLGLLPKEFDRFRTSVRSVSRKLAPADALV